MTQAKTSTNSRGGQTGYLLFLLVSILFAIFFIMPIVWSLANSFKPAAEALANPAALFSKTFRWRITGGSRMSGPAGMSMPPIP